MPVDHIRYDILAQDALRGLVRQVMTDAAKNGLPGDHHFYVSFDTTAEGVRLSSRMREKYPQEMTIVLQHQFWDLKVTDDGFEVGLSFGGVSERLAVPFDAITSFADPSVQFALQFQAVDEAEDEAEPAPAKTGKLPEKSKAKPRLPARHEPRASVPAAPSPIAVVPAADDAADAKKPASDKPGADVVRLDRFRKK